MLTENDVVESIVNHLISTGYHIQQALTTNEKGYDIIAEHPELGLCYVEAKGAKSSKESSARFKEGFNRNQARTHIGVVILKSFQTRQDCPNTKVCIALPKDRNHTQLIESIKTPLLKSGIGVFFVSEEKLVTELVAVT